MVRYMAIWIVAFAGVFFSVAAVRAQDSRGENEAAWTAYESGNCLLAIALLDAETPEPRFKSLRLRANLYSVGCGYPVDHGAAVDLYNEALASGDSSAAIALAVYFDPYLGFLGGEQERPVIADYNTAHALYELAIAGDTTSDSNKLLAQVSLAASKLHWAISECGREDPTPLLRDLEAALSAAQRNSVRGVEKARRDLPAWKGRVASGECVPKSDAQVELVSDPSSQAVTLTNVPEEERSLLAPIQQAQDARDENEFFRQLSLSRNRISSPDGKFFLGALMWEMAKSIDDPNLQIEAVDLMVDSGSPQARPLMGSLLINQSIFAFRVGNFRKAETAGERALTIENVDITAAIQLWETKYALGKLDEALALIDRSIRSQEAIGEQIPEYWYKRAMLLAYESRDSVRLARFSGGLRSNYPSQDNQELIARLDADARSWNQPERSQPDVAATTSGPRYALLIGNNDYDPSMGLLTNPQNDVALIAQSLRDVGFTVDIRLDLDQRSMRRAIQELGTKVGAAGPQATGLFFYAGHGMQVGGKNFLIPVDAKIEKMADIVVDGVAVDTVIAQMEGANAATNIIILDACRNLPLAVWDRGGTRGLATMKAPNGTFISYSTAPGALASDGGRGTNSPFASALANNIGTPNLPIEILFRRVRRDVLEATDGKQTPWDASSLVDGFVFNAGG